MTAIASSVGAVLVLTGCSSPKDDVASPPPATPSMDSSEPAATPGGGSPPIVSDWQPSNPLSSRIDMSEKEKMAKRATNLVLQAESMGLQNPPKIQLVRWITPEEWAPTLVKCLTDRGFPVGYTADGGINSANIPGEQAPALETAMYECMAQYSIDPRLSQSLNSEQRGILYDYLVESYVPCLGKLGVKVSSPPSREVFMATAEGDGWMPQLEISTDKVTEANAKCPTQPRSDVLYGS